MKVIKRDCTEVDFDKLKIERAILKAMKNGSGMIKKKIVSSQNICSNKTCNNTTPKFMPIHPLNF